MGMQSNMPPRRCAGFLAALLGGLTVGSSAAVAQDAAYFSPTYAASKGSPCSEIYARTFGAPALETAAPPPAAAAAGASPDVVYVIEDGRLLTYRATDYAGGSGEPLANTALAEDPAAPRLYGAVPPAPPDDRPVPLLPQN